MSRIPRVKAHLNTFGRLSLIAFLLSSQAAVSQTITTCPPLPGNYVILHNQSYALCAGALSVNFAGITYAKCNATYGDSISTEQKYSGSTSGNISTVNQGAPEAGGYVVSTYSPPEEVTAPLGNLALYTCSGGSYAQCDGGICFSSTTGKTSPLWGNVNGNQIICSCPITTTDRTFQVFGPRKCPTKEKDYDAICGANVNNTNNNGTTIYIGAPPGVSKQLAACLTGKNQYFFTCDQPQ